MTAYRTREFYHDPEDYHPFEQWLHAVAWLSEYYPTAALSEVFYELECSNEGKDTVDNWFVTSYTKTSEDEGDFLLEMPDD